MFKTKTKAETVAPIKTDMGIFVALDLGTTEIRAIAAKKDFNGELVALKTATYESKGIQRGAIQNITEVSFAIKHVLTDLEKSLQTLYNSKISNIYEKINVSIEKVYVALNGASIKTVTNRVSRRLGGDIINQSLLDEFDRENKNIQRSNDLEILDIQPIQFLVDDEETSSPIGCTCEVIQATYQIVLGKASLLSNLKTCLESIGRQLAGYCIAPQAAAESCVSKNEKELGIVMIDFGDSTTNVSVFYKGKMHYAIVIPLGSNLITNDIAELRIVRDQAEKIKKLGNCNLDKSNPETNFSIGLAPGRDISYHIVCEVIERRIDTILEYVKLAINASNLRVGPQLDQVVMIGKACKLHGLKNKVQQKLGLGAHEGQILNKYKDLTGATPGDIRYTSTIGALTKATENCVISTLANQPVAKKTTFIDLIGGLFKDEIPEDKENGSSTQKKGDAPNDKQN